MNSGVVQRILDRAREAKKRIILPESEDSRVLEAARKITDLGYARVILVGREQDIRKAAAMTKLYCSEMVNRAAYEAIQIHGGIGCLRETNVERVYRAVRILTILEGTSEMQRMTIARRLLKEEQW